eukprot:CAMPEP_0181246858 /NCGR_PEP_ID=MMETSP1096-20121128/44254_1 /TAXON_ID=156174 ORGANISM="Chrysochromulina ericina, Strain CCMP281" /NCGR_SAMPLE_ID=MMETSP1096 /ASSEMBLY_ACC=CAM_ASM_000453 /LENGTH=394 /DNA_ID=CAMNT_0023343775 /DNA_START=1468 /DNA_END=2650 /DNA_ORIENTATION=-
MISTFTSSSRWRLVAFSRTRASRALSSDVILLPSRSHSQMVSTASEPSLENADHFLSPCSATCAASRETESNHGPLPGSRETESNHGPLPPRETHSAPQYLIEVWYCLVVHMLPELQGHLFVRYYQLILWVARHEKYLFLQRFHCRFVFLIARCPRRVLSGVHPSAHDFRLFLHIAQSVELAVTRTRARSPPGSRRPCDPIGDFDWDSGDPVLPCAPPALRSSRDWFPCVPKAGPACDVFDLGMVYLGRGGVGVAAAAAPPSKVSTSCTGAVPGLFGFAVASPSLRATPIMDRALTCLGHRPLRFPHYERQLLICRLPHRGGFRRQYALAESHVLHSLRDQCWGVKARVTLVLLYDRPGSSQLLRAKRGHLPICVLLLDGREPAASGSTLPPPL